MPGEPDGAAQLKGVPHFSHNCTRTHCRFSVFPSPPRCNTRESRAEKETQQRQAVEGKASIMAMRGVGKKTRATYNAGEMIVIITCFVTGNSAMV